jgi:hypothetical protein
MCVGGVKLIEQNISVDKICDSLKVNFGNIRAASRDLGIAYYTIYREIDKYPEIKEVLEYSRKMQPDEELELAQMSTRKVMECFVDNDLYVQQATNVAIKTIDKLGYRRAYRDKASESDTNTQESLVSAIKDQTASVLSMMDAAQDGAKEALKARMEAKINSNNDSISE